MDFTGEGDQYTGTSQSGRRASLLRETAIYVMGKEKLKERGGDTNG